MFFLNDWFKNCLFKDNNNFFLLLFQEIFFFKTQIIKIFFINYFSTFFSALNLNFYSEIYTFETIFCFQIVFVIFLLSNFLNMYTAVFLTITKDEHFIDISYYSNFLSIEIEKEITCFDDIIIVFVFIMFVFG
jgi:hypothetical protein